MIYEELINGTPFQFKQVKGTFKVQPFLNGYAIFLNRDENFVYIEKIKEIGNMGIEFHDISPIFKTTFLHIQFIRNEEK